MIGLLLHFQYSKVVLWKFYTPVGDNRIQKSMEETVCKQIANKKKSWNLSVRPYKKQQ